MDFYSIKDRFIRSGDRKGEREVYPIFKIGRSKDIMVRGKSFYAVWDAENNIWSTDEYDIQRIVDADIQKRLDELNSKFPNEPVHAKFMYDFSSKSWLDYRQFVGHVSDNHKPLDSDLHFLNSDTTKNSYASKFLPYPLTEGSIDAYDELMSILYNPDERAKLEWAIGSIIAGEGKNIQKFIVLFGDPGTGKGTLINIVQKLFQGYYTIFEAKELAGNNNTFATETFKNNPLVAIQHDGDLSKIEDNSKLNSIISHEEIVMHEKYKSAYSSRSNAFLFMATNKPVKITDSKSGLMRRLIDVSPSGNRIASHKYDTLMSNIDFELGAIASHCLKIYKDMGKNYYKYYKPMDMVFKTDVFFNFVEQHYFIFKDAEVVTLKQAYTMYKEYCDDTMIQYKMAMYKFREALKDYFITYNDTYRLDGVQVRSAYLGFKTEMFDRKAAQETKQNPLRLVLDHTESLLDDFCADRPAQAANSKETPRYAWSRVKTTLKDVDTKEVHYVRLDEQHIVIDFDIQDEQGHKSLLKNLEAADEWPPTYAELSKSGKGVHLHYIYDGDVSMLKNLYAEHIEVKVFTGKSALRRKLSKCNNLPIATISSGLPLKKGDNKVLNFDSVKSERGLRSMINRNLKKEFHPGTKPSVDFILSILTDAYESGLKYDVTDMRPAILAFATRSTNQALVCIKLVSAMPFKSEEASEPQPDVEAPLVFYDVEVFPNLFVIVWKFKDKPPVRLINPPADQVAKLFEFNLIGFNNRRYDNHIMYAAYLGYNNDQLYRLSKAIISNDKDAKFAEAYGLSYTDIYDFSSKKQGLKKFQIELGIHHQELGLPWDQPVPEDKWNLVAEYCENDVISTEAVFYARAQDFAARQILTKLSGLKVNDTTQKHTARIIFGTDRNPQDKFNYPDLSEKFPGYTYSYGKSNYRGEDPKEGGYVYAEPGMWGGVRLLDIASMHPTTIILLMLFGIYTQNYKELIDARLAIKHGDYEIASSMLNGILKPFLKDKDAAEELSYALKIVINIVYGLTSAKFPNPFKDPRNVDNVVAKHGSLFMINLKHEVMERGFTVAHIKTDSIKIPDATDEIQQFVIDYGKKYGYNFEHEATYDKMCLVNNSTYIAKYSEKDGIPIDKYISMMADKGKTVLPWTATGTQFAVPYVYKTLFSGEDLTFSDLCETKSATTALYLDMNEPLPDVKKYEIEVKDRASNKSANTRNRRDNPELLTMTDSELESVIAKGHKYLFIGKAGAFTPIKENKGGGILVREKDGKYYAAGGSKGHRWLESETVAVLNKQGDIDMSYYDKLASQAILDIEEYGDFKWFVSEEPYDKYNNGIIPF